MTLEAVTGWFGFAGAWLLVGGPLYQGVLELREEDAGRAGADPAAGFAAPPPPPSIWWWFLPPVMLVLRRRRRADYRRTVLASLTPRQRAHRQRFIRKAMGWFAVAVGGSCIAIQETAELAGRGEWPLPVLLAVLLVMFAIVGANTVLQAGRQDRAEADGSGAGDSEP